MLRIPGLATGMDTDNMVKQLMKAEYMKVDKVKQQRQTLVWQQEAYRGVLEDFNMFKSTYFDVLKSDTYMLSNRNYASYQVSGAAEANGVKVTPGANAVGGSYTMNVEKVAKKAEFSGAVFNNVSTVGKTNFRINIDDSNDKVVVDGNEITLSKGDYRDLNSLSAEINNKISASTLKDKVKAVVKDDSIKFMNLLEIKDDNNIVDLKVNIDGVDKDFQVKLDNGNYTLEDLTTQINNKLKGLKSTDGTKTLTDTVKAELSANGTSISFSGTISSTPNGFNVNQISLAGSEFGDGITGTDVSINTDQLTYSKEIISGFNDTLNIIVGTDTYEVKIAPGKTDDSDILIRVTDALKNAKKISDGSTSDIPSSLAVSRTSEGNIMLSSASGKQIRMYGNASSVLGVSDNYELSMNSTEKMSNLVNAKVGFTINGVEFNYDFTGTGVDNNKTISDILADISSKANVDISYSQLTNKFSISSKNEGMLSKVSAKDVTGSFLSTLFGTSTIEATGEDAVVTINGTKVSKPTNNFTIDGVNYQLSSNTPIGTDITFNLSKDPSKTFENIKSLVDKYNEIIGKINSKLTEKKQYKYQPLTDEQRKDMKDDDIKLWEERAKMGIIKGDSQLQGMLIRLRQAFSDKVEGAGISLSDIGITTSRDYKEGGKLVIDEEKLKKAISENGDKVASLFTKETSSNYKYYDPDLTASQRKERYEDEGIFQRVNDILQDYTRITRDSKGRKGALLEKAGIKGDFSDLNSTLSKYITEKDDLIDRLNEKLADKENKYYLQFAQLERAMSQMNQQSAWLAQQFGGGGQ